MPTPNVIPKIIVADPPANRFIDQLLAVLNPILRNVAGDLLGPVAAPTVVRWRGLPLDTSMATPAVDQVPKWNGRAWVPGTAGTAGAVTAVNATAPVTSSGGTTPTIGIAGTPAGGVAYANGSTLAYTAAGTAGRPLISGGALAPSFAALALDAAGNVSGALPAGFGGTGNATYAVGDLLVASGATALSRLAIGAAGTFLGSDGTTATWQALPPSGVTSVSATAPLASSGGTTPTISVTPGAAGTFLYSDGASATWALATPSTAGAGVGGYRATAVTPAVVALTDYVVDITGTGSFVVNLPIAGAGAGQAGAGRIFVIKNSGGATITVMPAAAQTIDTAATFVVQTQFASFTFVSTGSGWVLV